MSKFFMLLILSMVGNSIIFATPIGKTNFRIDFELRGAKNGVMFVSYIDYLGHLQEQSISFKSSQFIFTDSIEEPTRMNFTYNFQSIRFFVEPGSRMQLIASVSDFGKSSLLGSTTNDDYLELEKKEGDKALSDYLKDKFPEASIRKLEISKMFILQKPDSFLSVWLLNSYFSDFGYQFCHQAFEQLSVKHKFSNTSLLIRKKLTLAEKSLPGSIVENFKAQGLDGKAVEWKGIIGTNKYVLVDFWTSSCVSCRENGSFLKSIYSNYHDKGLSILSISLDTELSKWKDAVAKDSISIWDHMIENENSSIQQSFGVEVYPTYFIVDNKGRILNRFNGKSSGKMMIEEKLKELFSSL